MENQVGKTRKTIEEDEIRTIERARLRALVQGDMETARRLHADDFQLISPGGITYTREEYLSGVESGEIDYRVWEPVSDIAVRLHGQVAHIRYRSQIENVYRGHKTLGSYWHTDTYEQKNGQWQVVWSQATRIL